MIKTVICSHGFAVRANSLGLFSDIKATFPGYEFTMFDYYDIKPNGDQVVRPLEEQAELLQQKINTAPDGDIILLCHSQGGTVAGLIDLRRVIKVILLAPPVEFDSDTLLLRLQKRRGSKLDRYGMSVVPRSDGTTMYMPSEYLDSLERYDRTMLYQDMADTVPTTIVRAVDDEILGLTAVDKLKNIQLIDIAADHNFTKLARRKLLTALSEVLIV